MMSAGMRKEDISIIALWVLILAGGLVVFVALGPLLEAVGDVLAAIVSGGALLLGGILTHALTEIRNQHLAQESRMQDNYARILDRIDNVIRSPNNPGDSFAKIHLETWAVGSPEVIRHTGALISCKNDNERRRLLNELVKAMRRDLGLSPTNLELPEGLFPPMAGA